MKQKVLALFIGCLLTGAAMAQASLVSKVINGTPFESIKVSGPVSVELIETGNPSVEAVGDYDFINNLSTSWSGKQLSISYSKDECSGSKPIRVYVSKLTTIEVEDGAKIITPKPLHSPSIRVIINGESYAQIVNYGGIKIQSDGSALVKNFNYVPE